MIPLTIAAALSVLLYVATVLVHYEALRLISLYIGRSSLRPRARVLVVLFGTVLAHLLEIGLYAFVSWFADAVLDIGGLGGPGAAKYVTYFYFSAETYTSLGMGDLRPTGVLRLITSLEVLNGLILIGWSTSFTFLAMSRLWDLHATVASPAQARPMVRARPTGHDEEGDVVRSDLAARPGPCTEKEDGFPPARR
jgi:hypothetical protein